MVRQDPYAVTAVRPTYAPLCSSLTVEDASSVASAAVLMRVSTTDSQYFTVGFNFFWLSNKVSNQQIYFPIQLFLLRKKRSKNVSLLSSCPVFPAPRPHGPKNGCIWKTRAVPGLLWVCRYAGLLQSNALFIAPQQCIIHLGFIYGKIYFAFENEIILQYLCEVVLFKTCLNNIAVYNSRIWWILLSHSAFNVELNIFKIIWKRNTVHCLECLFAYKGSAWTI